MLKIIPGHQAAEYPDLTDQIFRLRARVFDGRLGWSVQVKDGWERDRFDDCDPLYAVSVDDQDRVLGTFRLLQTTGPTMLREVFQACLAEELDIWSPLIWESTASAWTLISQRRVVNTASRRLPVNCSAACLRSVLHPVLRIS